MTYVGLHYVLDLEACLYFEKAGNNLQTSLFEKAEERRIAISKEVFKQVKDLNNDFANKIVDSSIEIIEYDDLVYQSTEQFTVLLTTLSRSSRNKVVSEKIQVIALVQCAQNGKKPPCMIVTGDNRTHGSSMTSLCDELGVPFIEIENFLDP